jgi:hypothetical protein
MIALLCLLVSSSALKLQQDPEFDVSYASYDEECGNRQNYKCWKKGGHSLDKHSLDTFSCPLFSGDWFQDWPQTDIPNLGSASSYGSTNNFCEWPKKCSNNADVTIGNIRQGKSVAECGALCLAESTCIGFDYNKNNIYNSGQCRLKSSGCVAFPGYSIALFDSWHHYDRY